MIVSPAFTPPPSCPECGEPTHGELCAGLCPGCLAVAMFRDPGPGERDAEAPQRCGDYELLERIAQGGMGTVWKARQRGLNRVVALKLMRDHWLPGEEAARRFRREGEAAARLRHRQIVAVHEVGEADGVWFISMEWIDGPSLAQRLRERSLPARDSVALVAQLARALQHAHERGVLHRDLKPGNLLLDRADAPHIADFGVAKMVESESDLTLAGAIFGTPAYMSPEQARGRHGEVTTTSDLYSLGAILYELLSGHPPFAASDAVELLRRVCEEEAAPPTQDRDLATICRKCLEKIPAARYGSALALAEDLERWLRGEPILARPLGNFELVRKWTRRRPLLAALWVVSTSAVLAIFVLLITARGRIDRERRAALASAEESQHLLAWQYAETGQQMVEAGDWHLALLPLAEAVRIGTGDPGLDQANRLRFETLVRLAPRLAQMWFPPAGATGVPLRLVSGDGEIPVLLVVDESGSRLWDAARGVPLAGAAAVPIWLGTAPGHPFDGGINRFGNRLVGDTGTKDEDRFTLWHMPSGTPIRENPGSLPKTLHGSATQPLGLEVIATQLLAWQGSEVHRYDTDSGLPAGPPLRHEAKVKWAAQLRGGENCVTFTEDGKLRLWNDVDALVAPPLAFDPGTTLRAVSQTQPWLALRSGDDLTMLDFLTGTPLATVHASNSVFATDWTHAGRWIYAERSAEGVKVRDAATGFAIFSAPHASRGYGAGFSSAAAETFTLGWNGTARIWKTKDGEPLTPLLRCAGIPHTAAITADGMSFVLDSDEPAARLWRRRERDGAEREFETGSEVRGVSFSGQRLVASCKDGRVLAWDAATGATLPSAIKQAGLLDEGGIRIAGDALLTVSRDALQRWNLASGAPDGVQVTAPGGFLSATLSADGRRIAAVLADGTAVLFDPVTGQRLGQPFGHALEHCVFSSDGRALLVSGGESAQSWDATTGEPRSPEIRDGDGTRACFSPDGRRILTWGRDRNLQQPRAARLWDATTAAPIGRPMTHRDGIINAAFSADGARIVTASEDQTARVWNGQTGEPVTVPVPHSGPVEGAGFSPGGLFFWTLCGNNARVWQTATGAPVTPPLHHPKSVRKAAWSADGRWFASVGGRSTVRLWNVSADARPVAEMRALAHLLSAHALAPSGIGATVPLTAAEVRAAWKEASGGQAPPAGER